MKVKKNKFWLLAGSVIFSISFILLFNKYEKDLSKTKLETYFEPNQIAELNKITEFVIGQITNGCNEDQASCIFKYFDRYKGYKTEITGISKFKQRELLNSLSNEIFTDIWNTCKGTRSYSRDSVVNVESLCPKTDGRFGSFIIDYCSTKNRLSGYGNTFEMASDYTPTMTLQLLENTNTFELSTKEELLILSIHLLTLNSEFTILESVPTNRPN